jgi:predicted PurR-regulated permease PerM
MSVPGGMRGFLGPVDLTGDVTEGTSASRSASDLESRSPNPQSERLVIRSALRVLLLTLLVLVLALLAWRLRVLLLLVVVSGFVAVLVNPFVRFLIKRGIRRTLAALIVYLLFVIIGAALGFVMLHPLYNSAIHFARVLPKLVRQAQHGRGAFGHLITRLHLASYVDKHAPQLEQAITHLSKPALEVGKSVVSGIVSLVTIAFMSFFIVIEGPAIFRAMLTLISPRRANILRKTADAMASQVTGFMLGDLATSVIAGIVLWVTLLVTGVPFAGVFAIWVALVDFLPLVGGLLAGVPTVGFAFIHSIPAGIVTVIVFLVYQQVEDHILYPIIVSRTVSLNPLLVLLAVLIGAETGEFLGSTFGAIAGAILAVPAAGSLQILAREYLREHRGTADSGPAAPS